MKFVSLLFAGLTMTSMSQAILMESFVRVEYDEDGNKMVMMYDDFRVGTFLLNDQGQILDCQTIKMDKKAVWDAQAEEEFMTGDYRVQYLRMDLDVAWYVRRCNKYIRDMLIETGLTDPIQIDFVDRINLGKGWPGTKYCISDTPINPLKETPDEELVPADQCCKDFYFCKNDRETTNVVRVHEFEGNFYNPYTYNVPKCSCLKTFKNCLKTLKDDELAAKLYDLFFKVLKMKCFKQETITYCNEYSTWFENCTDSFEETRFFVKNLV